MDYKFSVVMSVYNVDSYIREAVESVLKQTIGFRSSIQLIFIDDGSTDTSGVICDEYKKLYPENVIVLHKKNEGLARARVSGMKYVKGKYVSFFDPDDIISPETFENVFNFFEKYNSQVDVVAIPLILFGDIEGEHPLNTKFKGGTRVIDLMEGFTATQMSMASAFFKAEVLSGLEADDEIVTAEDAKELIKILTNKNRLGVVCEACYHYRKRKDSNVGSAQSKKGWYLTYLSHFSEWALDYCLNKLNCIPPYIQYTILYDLQWKYRQNKVREGILSQNEIEKYQTQLFEIAKYFDDNVIIAQESLDSIHQLYLLYRKYQKPPCIIKDPQSQMTYFAYGRAKIPAEEALAIQIRHIKVKKHSIIIQGTQTYPKLGLGEPKTYIRQDNSKLIPTEIDQLRDSVNSAGIEIAYKNHFRAEIPLSFVQSSIQFVTQYNGTQLIQEQINFGKYAPLTDKIRESYYAKGHIMIWQKGNSLHINTHSMWWEKAVREVVFDSALLKMRKPETIKAICARYLYFVAKIVLPKNIWLIADKSNRADDNGEALFSYLCANRHNCDCHPIFAISKNSSDYKRVKAMGTVIPYMSWYHKMLHLIAQHTISAYSHDEISSPFLEYSYCYCDILQNNKIVFLQHGITKDNVSRALNYEHKNYALFVTSAVQERQSILNGNYGYSANQVILTGLPRYDLLYNDPQRKITIMPTWQSKLVGEYDAKTSRWNLLPGFTQSAYYQFYSSLINDGRLLTIAENAGYTIQFLIHPVFMPYIKYFKPDYRVVVLDETIQYRKVFAESELVITDYSSAVFDFAYLRKPVIYTQFEKNHYERGYFDYERDGFGEVEYDLGSTIDRIIEYMQNGCQLKDKYRERIDKFFAFNDRNNCQRVYEKIKELIE